MGASVSRTGGGDQEADASPVFASTLENPLCAYFAVQSPPARHNCGAQHNSLSVSPIIPLFSSCPSIVTQVYLFFFVFGHSALVIFLVGMLIYFHVYAFMLCHAAGADIIQAFVYLFTMH